MGDAKHKFGMYIDASGNDGIKFETGSSSHYAVGCVKTHVSTICCDIIYVYMDQSHDI